MDMDTLERARARQARRAAVGFVVILGVVSLLADMTYEGARSITGPYLALLGAGATAVGLVAGLGELVGNALRVASGYLSDRTGRYWLLTLLGYAVNLLAVPLLALADRWEVAAILIVAERTGKALRSPARDAMLSHATKQIGHGWGFGLHEAMDQLGAMLGPLIVAAVLAARGSYRAGFAVLLLPAVLALAVLVVGYWLYPRPQDLDQTPLRIETNELPRRFWLYLAGVAALAAGFVDFPLIAFNFERAAALSQTSIPLLYALAMGVDALAALVFGYLFDRYGLGVLVLVALLSAGIAPLVFAGGLAAALVGMTLWGISMGAQESIMRAAIAGMVTPGRRGSAYGILNAGYGVAWFAGSALMGVVYERALLAVIAFAVIMPLVAAAVFYRSMQEQW